MNWYELATASEVEEVLSNVYRRHWDGEDHVVTKFWEAQERKEYVRPVNYEIAEALWGEYSEELFD